MSPIFHLPYELISYVVRHLSLEDIHCLSLASKRFQFLTQEPNISKRILDTKAKESPEARRSRATLHYARELRRLLKRREALSAVQPFTAAIIAVAERWLYVNGTLLYTYERQLRILDLHKSASTEQVIDVRELVGEVIESSRTSRKFKFQPLHVAEDIVSCLYTHIKPNRESWLVVFNAKERRILTAPQLDTAYKIFVRNNERFLYYGTHSHVGRDNFRRWVLRAYDIRKDIWLEDQLPLETMVGSDIGSTICFDIFDGYFYGMASSITFEVEETEWTSYYRVFRFPTDPAGFKKLQWARDMWRRQHAEGPIDDRWTFLRNFRDEETGQQRILESRKEWLSGRPSARRTYYMTCFAKFGKPGCDGAASDDDSSSENDSERDDEAEEQDNPIFSRQDHVGGQTKAGGSRIIPGPRDPRMVHPGDDGESSLMITLNKCYIRSYHPACETFIDLVDDQCSGTSKQRVRIRGATRSLRPHSKRNGSSQRPVAKGSCSGKDEEGLFVYHDVTFWPPEQDPEGPDSALADLTDLLNPPSHLGNIHGVWDDRSFLYSTGGKPGECSAVVFLSFDAGIRLEGIQPYPGIPPVAMRAGEWMKAHPNNSHHTTFSETSTFSPASQPNPAWSDVEVDTRHKGKEIEIFSTQVPEHNRWCKTMRAMYRDISRGYHFFHGKP